jgi:hypothetical protein
VTNLDDGTRVTWRVSGVHGKIDLRTINRTMKEAQLAGVAPELIERTEQAFARVLALHRSARTGKSAAKHRLAEECAQSLFELANHLNSLIKVRPEVFRTRKLQEGQREKRGPRRPLLTEWLQNKIKSRPDLSNKELWESLPTTGELERDGDIVYEGKSKPITQKTFNNRASKIRNPG